MAINDPDVLFYLFMLCVTVRQRLDFCKTDLNLHIKVSVSINCHYCGYYGYYTLLVNNIRSIALMNSEEIFLLCTMLLYVVLCFL